MVVRMGERLHCKACGDMLVPGQQVFAMQGGKHGHVAYLCTRCEGKRVLIYQMRQGTRILEASGAVTS